MRKIHFKGIKWQKWMSKAGMCNKNIFKQTLKFQWFLHVITILAFNFPAKTIFTWEKFNFPSKINRKLNLIIFIVSLHSTFSNKVDFVHTKNQHPQSLYSLSHQTLSKQKTDILLFFCLFQKPIDFYSLLTNSNDTNSQDIHKTNYFPPFFINHCFRGKTHQFYIFSAVSTMYLKYYSIGFSRVKYWNIWHCIYF